MASGSWTWRSPIFTITSTVSYEHRTSPDTWCFENTRYLGLQAFELGQFKLPLPKRRVQFEGKGFLKEHLGLTSCEVSLNQLPPEAGIPFFHKHRQNEEVYVFLRGEGEMVVDGETIAVREGSAVRVAPDGARSLRNTNANEFLIFLVIQAPAHQFVGGTIEDGYIVKID